MHDCSFADIDRKAGADYASAERAIAVACSAKSGNETAALKFLQRGSQCTPGPECKKIKRPLANLSTPFAPNDIAPQGAFLFGTV